MTYQEMRAAADPGTFRSRLCEEKGYVAVEMSIGGLLVYFQWGADADGLYAFRCEDWEGTTLIPALVNRRDAMAERNAAIEAEQQGAR